MHPEKECEAKNGTCDKNVGYSQFIPRKFNIDPENMPKGTGDSFWKPSFSGFIHG